MKISWGWKAGLLYGAFVAMMVTLVVASSRQKIDLVSKDYYKDEIEYQRVIDAGKNQSELSVPLVIRANESVVSVEFPSQFRDKIVKGELYFYSPVNDKWDRKISLIAENNSMSIDRSKLLKTRYTMKINWEVDGKKYYQETAVNLN
jgi:hypothetical protein